MISVINGAQNGSFNLLKPGSIHVRTDELGIHRALMLQPVRSQLDEICLGNLTPPAGADVLD